jgi:predicted permease
MLILALAGYALERMKIFDKVGELKLAQANINVFVPCFVFVSFSTSCVGVGSGAFALLFLSYCLSIGVAFCLTFTYCRMFKTDVRITQSLSMITVFGNVGFAPLTMLAKLCAPDGFLAGNATCGNAKGYCFFELFLVSVILLAIGHIYMDQDRGMCVNLRRQMVLVKHFYRTPQAFLNDKDLREMDLKPIEGNKEKAQEPAEKKENAQKNVPETFVVSVNVEKQGTNINAMQEAPKDLVKKKEEVIISEVPLTPNNLKERFFARDSKVSDSILDDVGLKNYAYSINLDRQTHEQWEKHFAQFLDKLSPEVYSIYSEKLPNPMERLEWDLDYLYYVLTKKAIIFCVLGIFIGLIPTAMNWLYAPYGGSKYFMGTVGGIAGETLPLAVMIWGVRLAPGLLFYDVNLRLMDQIACVVIRMILVPAIGLGFMNSVMSWGIPDIQNDVTLAYSMYGLWNCYPCILLLTLFVLSDYYAREGSLLTFWCLIIGIVSIPLFTWAFFSMQTMNF